MTLQTLWMSYGETIKERVTMKRRKGFTLVEVVLTIALISMVVLGGTNLVTFGIRGHRLSMDEFDIQSNLRLLIHNVNTTIRDTSAVFLLHRENADNLTEEWNYIMLSPEKDRLLNYVWNSSTSSHDVQEMFPGIEGITLELDFNKDSEPNESEPNESEPNIDRLLEFGITVNGLGETRTIDTEIEAKNSLQIVDRSYLEEPNVLAYRNDSRLDEVSNAQAAVAMVLDKSGSMGDRMDGGSANDSHSNPTRHSRMKLMKKEATRLVEELADLPNVYVSINPFDSTANSSQPMMNAKQELNTSPGLKSIIDGLSANGGTNTGDGIRRAYYRIKDFNERPENTSKTNKNFMIILVDGVTTFASVHENVTQHTIQRRAYDRDAIPEETIIYNGREYVFDYSEDVYEWNWWSWEYVYDYTNLFYTRDPYTNYVMGEGNIDNSWASNNVLYSNGAYFGFGNDLDPYGTAYVDLIGDMVKDYKEGTNEEIKVYVIGFSAVPADYGSLEDIALATTDDTVYYEAGSSEALEEIFSAIQRDISDALWHIGGPN